MEKDIIGFGIAGNFAHHLEQAGESADFVDVVVDEEDAPKGIFPTYVPYHDSFLGTYPFSSKKIAYLEGKNLQVEPEVGLLCDVRYEDGKISALLPRRFMAYNDCSIRVEGAKKISHKKNWGEDSKGVSQDTIAIDSFREGGVMDGYSLTSFIKRGEKIIQYGENSALLGYSYFYEKLEKWMIQKLNQQKDTGPLEDLQALLSAASYPKNLLISIGATRYTEFGEHHFLERGDILYVIVYPHKKIKHEEIIPMIKENHFALGISTLIQEVV